MPGQGFGYAFGFPFGWVYTLTGQVEITPDQALDLLIQLLPQGAEKLYGLWAKTGDVYQFYAGLADALKGFCYDYIALLRAEINPATSTFKLPDWESALGISGTQTSRTGTAAQQRLAIVSKLREQGAFTELNVRSILGPLLGYADPTALVLIEANRAALKTAHTYAGAAFSPATVAGNGVGSATATVADDGGCSDAGAQLTLNITCTNPEQLFFQLQTQSSPGTGTANSNTNWPAGTLPAGAAVNKMYQINTVQIQDIKGDKITGAWTFAVNTGAATCTVNSWSLFVEGGGARDAFGNSGLGMQMHDWMVKFESGKSSTAPDFGAVNVALERISPAESNPVVVSNSTAAAGATLFSPFICEPT